ncbi:MAG TPA: T9SS type A sorting domain-containing protein [Caldithrix sp.]|nr:T9SS type A sorting domain-containing protein [Caldithrix sp.]
MKGKMNKLSDSLIIVIVISIICVTLLSATTPTQNEVAKIKAGDGSAESFFGTAVSIDNDRCVIGASLEGEHGWGAGAAYVYHKSGNNWVEQDKIVANDAAAYFFFGTAVSIDNDRLIVGATGANTGIGAAYIFYWNGNHWIEEGKIVPSDGANGDGFGTAVSISGDYVVVGASGKALTKGVAYVFHRNGSQWTEEFIIVANDGMAADRFGCAVSLESDRVLIGARGDDPNGAASGSAYLFSRNGINWNEEQKVWASDGVQGEGFGSVIHLSGNRCIVGAPNAGPFNTGKAYIFRKDGGNWTEEKILTASDAAMEKKFGSSVAISGELAVVGSSKDNENGNESGSGYVYLYNGIDWVENVKLLPSDGAAGDEFGSSAALDGYTAIVGSPADDDSGSNSGSAYLFELSAQPPPVVKWEEKFESQNPPPGWQVVDNDGSGSTLVYLDQIVFTSGDTVRSQAGQYFWHGNFNSANGSGLIDEWLISPQIQGISNGDSLFFWAGAIGGNFQDSLKVLVSTTNSQIGSFTNQIGYFKVDGPIGSWHQYVFDLSPFDGSDIYIAVNYYIRHGGPAGANSDNVWIDHFTIVFDPSVPIPPDPGTVEEKLIPKKLQLSNNYPNPFNLVTTIRYDIPRKSMVLLGIYDAMGREVKTLVKGWQPAGKYTVSWDGTNYVGQTVSSGVYLCQFRTERYNAARKLLLIR